MTFRSWLITAIAVSTFLGCGHFGVDAYVNARHLKAQSETIAVRTRLMKRQVGEMEQKMRVLQRVGHFVDRAKALHLDPQEWATYDVQIQDTMSYQTLSQIVEQCVHNKNIYFKPLAFHVAVNPGDALSSDVASKADQPVPLKADASEGNTADVSLALQGTFMVRH